MSKLHKFIADQIARNPLAGMNLDASGTAVFAKQLEQILATTYDFRFPELRGRMIVPKRSDIEVGADSYTYRQYSRRGAASVATSYSGDAPRADVDGQEESAHIIPLRSSFEVTVDEARKLARNPDARIEERRMKAAMAALEESIDQVIADGKVFKNGTATAPRTDFKGLINQANALEYTLTADGTGSTKTFSTKTPEKVLRDLHAIANYVPTSTSEVERPDTMVLPNSLHRYVTQTPMSADNGKSILQQFLDSTPYIKRVEPWYKLESAGASSTKRIVVFASKDIWWAEPLSPLVHPPVFGLGGSLSWVFQLEARIGAVVTPYPKTVCFADGA